MVIFFIVQQKFSLEEQMHCLSFYFTIFLVLDAPTNGIGVKRGAAQLFFKN
jgi:hypothetical protein